MRSHHAPPHVHEDPPWRSPPPLSDLTKAYILEEAGFVLRTCLVDWLNCQLCGAPISYPDVVAATAPHGRVADKICWACLITILHERGALDMYRDPLPSRYGSGTFQPDLTRLLPVRHRDRRS